jgi:PadR family transcriptional regulator, regulatory protein PadR
MAFRQTAFISYNIGNMAETYNLGEFEQLVLLAILRLQRDGAYGVSIRAELALRTERDPAPGAIYTTLERLQTKGFVESEVGESTPQRGGRSKRYYRVTPEGLRSLRRARREFQRLAQGLTVFGKSNA